MNHHNQKNDPHLLQQVEAGRHLKGIEMSTPTIQQPERLLNVQQVADLLTNGNKQRIYRMRESGHLPPAVKIGQSIRWRESVIAQWITDHEEVA